MHVSKSARGRSSLFFETPVCSGPPSYGGVLRSNYLYAFIIFFISLIIIGLLFAVGLFPPTTFVGAPISGLVTFFGLIIVSTRKRRDYMAVVIAAWKFNKEEKGVLEK